MCWDFLDAKGKTIPKITLYSIISSCEKKILILIILLPLN